MIARLVSITLDLEEVSKDEDLANLHVFARALIFKDCNYYIPCSSGIICASGETNGEPFVPKACERCIVGQFSSNGKFVGELNEDSPQKEGSEDSNIF